MWDEYLDRLVDSDRSGEGEEFEGDAEAAA
jgi:hypothetical protein